MGSVQCRAWAGVLKGSLPIRFGSELEGLDPFCRLLDSSMEPESIVSTFPVAKSRRD